MDIVKRNMGWIEVIVGPMFSGKSEELIRRLKRAEIARQRVQIFKPLIDQRYTKNGIVSHSGLDIPADCVTTATEVMARVEPRTEVVGIDEAQFLGEELLNVCTKLADMGKRVIVAGLDTDYLGRPFEPIPRLLAIAEEITKLLAICREMEIEAVGVSGVDAGLIKAHKRGPVKVEGEMVDYGFVGDIDLVDESVLKKLLDSGLMPVVSPLSADDKGTLLNINADTVAAAIGAALGAEKLILCTGAPGILERLNDPTSVISYTDLKGLKQLRENGSLSGGMLPKATAIETAIRGGVRRVLPALRRQRPERPALQPGRGAAVPDRLPRRDRALPRRLRDAVAPRPRPGRRRRRNPRSW